MQLSTFLWVGSFNLSEQGKKKHKANRNLQHNFHGGDNKSYKFDAVTFMHQLLSNAFIKKWRIINLQLKQGYEIVI